MTVRTTIGMVALGATLASLGCDGPTTAAPVDPPTEAAVTISVFGTRPDADGYNIVLRTEDGEEIASREVEAGGGTARFKELAPRSYAVAVEAVADNCSVAGDNPRSFTVRDGRISAIGFEVSCPGPEVIAEYRRTTPEHLADRYFLNEDDTFLLDGGLRKSTGTYSLAESETEIVFDFHGFFSRDGRDAIGTFEGDCMTVEYGPRLALSGFQRGEFCR